MPALARSLETSILLAEKIASARPASIALRERAALADFATFGLFKAAALDPAALSSLQRGLGWGVGLGLPALGVGHALLGDARRHSESILRDARNQALLTAAGVEGIHSLGGMLRQPPQGPASAGEIKAATALNLEQRLAAAILVDDVLEAACDLPDERAKSAALVQLVLHRVDATRLLRGMVP